MIDDADVGGGSGGGSGKGPGDGPDTGTLDVSIIVACYNGAATLGEALESLTAQVWDGGASGGTWEVLLADNGSTDGSAEIFARHARRHPHVRMRRIDASARRGKVAALNAGLAAAAGRAFVFLDCDDTVPPDWLAAMATALAGNDFVAAFLDTATLNEGWVRTYRTRDNKPAGLRRLTHAPHCLIAGGGEIGFTRRVYEAVGGFDPAFAVQEDHDFCVRAHLAGFELKAVPDARYNYRFRDDFAQIYRQAYVYARYRGLLRKRYAPEPFLSPLPWLELGQRILRLGGSRAMVAVRGLKGRPWQPLERARFNVMLGQALGEGAGALAWRVAPPQRRRGPRAHLSAPARPHG